MNLNAKLLEDAHILMHPTRYRIVELLAEKLMHINALNIALGMERRLVSYHLATLEDCGFMRSKYEISEEPKAKGKALGCTRRRIKWGSENKTLKGALRIILYEIEYER